MYEIKRDILVNVSRRLLPPNRILPVVNSLCDNVLGSPVWQRYCTALEQWASAKLCSMVQEVELWNFRCSSFSTEGATYIENLF